MINSELLKKIVSLCEIKGIHVAGCELRSYNSKELSKIYRKLVSNSSITNPNNSSISIKKLFR